MATGIHFCSTLLHDGEHVDAQFLVKWGNNKSYACCEQHLGHAIKLANYKRRVINFRIFIL